MSETMTIPEFLPSNKEESMTTHDLVNDLVEKNPKLDKIEKIEKIVVIGIGGAGNNAVQYLYEQNNYLETVGKSVEHYVLNTDENCLRAMKCEKKIVLGPKKCRGKGAGANINVGKEATLETLPEIKEICKGADLIFIAAGMGGGTGTLGASVVASAAHEDGAIVVSLVTLPFRYENRFKPAFSGVKELFKFSDSLILIDNQKIVEFYPDLEFSDGLDKANEILANAISGVIKIIHNPSKINTDFEDLKTILHSGGKSQILYNQLEGDELSTLATEPDKAIDNIYNTVTESPLVAKSDIKKASSFLMLFECTHHFTQKIIDKLVQKFSNPENKQNNTSYEDYLDNLDSFSDDFDFPDDEEDLPKVIFAYNKIKSDEKDEPKIIVTIVATGMDNKKPNESEKKQVANDTTTQTQGKSVPTPTQEVRTVVRPTIESPKTTQTTPEANSNSAIDELDIEQLFQSLSNLDKSGLLPDNLRDKYEELKVQLALKKLKAQNSTVTTDTNTAPTPAASQAPKVEHNREFGTHNPKASSVPQFTHEQTTTSSFNIEKSPNTPVNNNNPLYTKDYKDTAKKESSEPRKIVHTFLDTDIGIDE